MNKNKLFITTPLYYLNSEPHIGTLYSTVLADVSARWNRLCGKKVFFLTGSDEHGQKIEQRAKQEGKEVKAFVDSMVSKFKDAWKVYDISYDKFIRTTSEEHKQGVYTLIERLQGQDDVYKAEYDGLYCIPCETFITKQKDGKKLKCPSCQRSLTQIKEESYFFRLSAYQDRLLEFYEQNPTFILPKERLNEVVSFVKSGLKDLSISRKTVKWGVPFPRDDEYTVYVWADALVNYISGIGFGAQDVKSKEQFDFWWPADVHLLGKDILRFHAVYWPAFLMSAGLTLPKHLLVHGFILFDDKKMSKSLGNVVDPLELAKLYGSEQIRYYLVRQIAVTHDGHFSMLDVEKHITADLANNLGNLLNRTLTLAVNNRLDSVAPTKNWQDASVQLREKCEEAFRGFWDEMSHYQYHVALSDIWKFIHEVNTFFHEQQPWILAKTNKKLFEEVISAVCHSLYAIGVMLWPVMPKKMEILLTSIGCKLRKNHDYSQELRENIWDKRFTLTRLDEPLFVRPEQHSNKIEEQEEAKKNKEKKQNNKQKGEPEMITIDDFEKIQLLVGQIISCEKIEDSEKLYQLTVDMGSHGKRTVLAGVAKEYAPEQLIGKRGIYVANLKPRTMAGVESQGMMLFAKSDGKLVMATVADDVENGTRLA